MKWGSLSFIDDMLRRLEAGETPTAEELARLRAIVDRDQTIMAKRSEQQRRNLAKHFVNG